MRTSDLRVMGGRVCSESEMVSSAKQCGCLKVVQYMILLYGWKDEIEVDGG